MSLFQFHSHNNNNNNKAIMSFVAPTASSFIPSSRVRNSTRHLCPRRKSHGLSEVRCCVEQPSWRKLAPVDPDFAKDEQLEILEEKLDESIAAEQFKDAADIRNKLARLQSGAMVAVLSTNNRFYQALNKKSIVDMAGIWMQSPNTTCKHIGGPLLQGYIDVINSYGYLFTEDIPLIDVANVRIIMRGSIGYLTCDELCTDEKGNEFKMSATTLLAKRNGQWYITHHSSLLTSFV